MSIPLERMKPEEIERLKIRRFNRDGSAELLCSKAWAHIALQQTEINALRTMIGAVAALPNFAHHYGTQLLGELTELQKEP
jgi:hypothetical protein